MTAYRRMTMKALGGAAAALALALTTPALAQESDAPIDVTVAPPPSAETIGPSQLRDFNLQGTVTRPADRSASLPQPAATVPQAATEAPDTAPSVSGAANRAPAPRAPAASARRPAQSSPADLLASTNSVTPSLPLDVTTGPAPQPSYDDAAPGDSADLPADNGFPSWPWLAALIALLGGGAFIAWSKFGRRRRQGDPGRMAFAGLVPDVVPGEPPIPPTRPRPDPVPPRAQPKQPASTPKPAPKPADDGLIVSTRLKPQLNVEFQPDRAIVTDSEALVRFDVVITNSGSAPARDVLVEARLFTAHAAQDAEIGAFFQNPMTEGDRMTAIAPLGRISLKSIARLPLDQLHSFEVEGRRLFVPMMGFNILFRSGAGEGQASASFLVGRGSDEDEKLAPFRLDLGPRMFRGLSARPHSMGLQR